MFIWYSIIAPLIESKLEDKKKWAFVTDVTTVIWEYTQHHDNGHPDVACRARPPNAQTKEAIHITKHPTSPTGILARKKKVLNLNFKA